MSHPIMQNNISSLDITKSNIFEINIFRLPDVLILCRIPVSFDTLLTTFSMCDFQFNLQSKVLPET